MFGRLPRIGCWLELVSDMKPLNSVIEYVDESTKVIFDELTYEQDIFY